MKRTLGREAAEAELHRTEREARKARMRIKKIWKETKAELRRFQHTACGRLLKKKRRLFPGGV
jgi:hypothetical protein